AAIGYLRIGKPPAFSPAWGSRSRSQGCYGYGRAFIFSVIIVGVRESRTFDYGHPKEGAAIIVKCRTFLLPIITVCRKYKTQFFGSGDPLFSGQLLHVYFAVRLILNFQTKEGF